MIVFESKNWKKIMQADFIKSNVEKVFERIERACDRAGRKKEEITLIAVSKTFPAEFVKVAHYAGVQNFGENYVQEALKKMEELSELQINWHFVGRLQTNKAKFIPGRFKSVHSVDSIKLVRELERRCEKAGVDELELFVQVNVGEEETKAGLPPQKDTLLKFFDEAHQILRRCKIVGLMCIPPPPEKPEDSRPYFAKLVELKNFLESRGFKIPYLSMGMTDDFEVAIEEGATHIRIGRAIFGEREKK